MQLVLLFDHRFYRDAEGRIFSLKNYTYEFFAQRYLPAFDSVRVVARVARVADHRPDVRASEGPGVKVRSLGDWNGPGGFLAHAPRLAMGLGAETPKGAAIIMVAPGMLGSLAYHGFRRHRRPYGIEVVGDPHDGLAPRAMRHPLRPLLRRLSRRQLRRQCAGAAAAAYVTREALQRGYPCPRYSVGVSDVELRADAFTRTPRRCRSRS